MNNLKYVSIHKQESYGTIGGFGLEIKVAADKLPDLKQELIRNAVYEAVDKIKSEVCAAIKKADPKTAGETAKNEELLSLFHHNVFVEETPNGYCKDWCCRHLPWFVVTTTIGKISIGWRKRVIEIDWSDTVGTGKAIHLFKDEDVTMGTRYIHAWSMEKAKEYIERIMKSGKSTDL